MYRENRNVGYTTFLSESLQVKEHLRDLGVDGRITLNRSYGNNASNCELASSGLE
jgi:hypothetical protein